MAPERGDDAGDLHGFALAKMEKVLGPDRARQVLARTLEEHALALRTPEDLLTLSEVMTSYGGFEAAVGAMLGVAAVLRGATPRSR